MFAFLSWRFLCVGGFFLCFFFFCGGMVCILARPSPARAATPQRAASLARYGFAGDCPGEHPEICQYSVVQWPPFSPFLVAAPLKWSSQKRVPIFFQGP